MTFEGILRGYVGKEITISSPGHSTIKSKLIEFEGNYYVEGNGNSIPIEEIDSTRAGKVLDVMLYSDSDFFQGGLLN